MKTCLKCKNIFDDDLHFCLEDGVALVEISSDGFKPTLAFSQEPTMQLPNRTNAENKAQICLANRKLLKLLPFQIKNDYETTNYQANIFLVCND
jgi:hypothetical protein